MGPTFVVQQAHFLDVVLRCAKSVPPDALKTLLPLMARDYLRVVWWDELWFDKRMPGNISASNFVREESVFSYSGQRLLALHDLVARKWDRDFASVREQIIEAIERSESKYGRSRESLKRGPNVKGVR